MRVHRRISMRVLLARVSILVGLRPRGLGGAGARPVAYPGRACRPNVPAVKTGDAPTKAAGEASSAARWKRWRLRSSDWKCA